MQYKIDRLKIKQHFESVFYKTVLIYLCLMVPLYAVFILICNYSSDNMKHQASSFFSSQSSFFLDKWDSEIQNISQIMFSYTIDDDIETVAQIPSCLSLYDRVRRLNLISKKMVSITYCNSYVTDASVFIPAVETMVSSSSGIYHMSSELYEETVASVGGLSSLHTLYSQPDTNGNILVIVTDSAFSTANSNSNNFIISANLSAARIQKSLNSFRLTDHTFTVLFNQNMKTYITSSSAPAMTDDWTMLQDSIGAGEGSSQISIDGTKYQCFFTQSAQSAYYLATFVPLKELYPFSSVYVVFNAVFWVLGVLLIGIFCQSIRTMIKKPIDTLCSNFRGDNEGKLRLYTGYKKHDEFQILFQSYNSMVNRIQSLINEVYMQQLLVQKSELKQLQSQMNPHFLYNSFFTLSLLAKTGDSERTTAFAKCLGEYFHYITRHNTIDAPLRDELSHAMKYAEIQCIRFCNRLDIRFEPLPEQYSDWQVPAFILQPILENAFVHGIEERSTGGRICVSWEPFEAGLAIHVDDNGAPPSEQKLEDICNKINHYSDEQNITALVNINRRIRFYYSNDSHLEINQSPLGGWRVSLILFSKKENAECHES